MSLRRSDPKIYLAVDNCFASKKWVRPAEWMELLGRMGIACVEASADNECDPLYMDREYLKRWVQEVNEESRKLGVRVVNLYSGHGTYMTLGLAHYDIAVRDKIQHEWLKPMVDIAAQLGAGLGFYCHAFSDSVLQSVKDYNERETDLYKRLADIAKYSHDQGVRTPGVEQMYTPHQIPWTIEGSKRLLREVFRLSQLPFYLTLDTGHQSGQFKFHRPNEQEIVDRANDVRNGGYLSSFWLGPLSAYELFQQMLQEPVEKQAAYVEQIIREMECYPHLFATQTDSDTYRWLEELGCYSPIIHLQQTMGSSSAHLSFTEENNREGIIHGESLLSALEKAYQTPDDKEFPPKCEEIHLTLEIFSSTSEMNMDILNKMEDSIVYWRQFVPIDGMKLSEALQNLKK